MVKNILAFMVALGGLNHAIAQAQTSMPQDVHDNIKARIDNGINTGIVVGIIDATGTHYYSYGVKSLKSKEPVDEHSVFEIGSVTKTFTAIILADMVIKGQASLDDPLQNYLPAGVTAPTRNGASIKLVNLSNHTSSLPAMPDNFKPADPANPFADYSEKQLYDFLTNYKLTRDIGSEFEYSNYAAGLLGHVLVAKKGTTYEKSMIDVIAGPLDLKDTRIAFTPNMKANLAMGYNQGVEVENWDLSVLEAAGAIRSTTIDMVKYVSANMGKIKSDVYPAMQLTHTNTRPEGSRPIQIGLAWLKAISPTFEVVWHNGGTGGYRTFVGFINDGDKGVVVLSNSNASVDDIGMHILNPKVPLTVIKSSIAMKLQTVIDAQGIEAGVKAYQDMKKNQANDFDFSEGQLNRLGINYLLKNETAKAIAILSLNAEVFPQSSAVFYSLGDGYAQKGDNGKAIENYKKSIAINPANQPAIDKLKKLGVSETAQEVIVDTKTLDTYVGKYQLAPTFILTISRDGNQLKAQATGQPEFPVFPKTQNIFYLKVVEAQLTFNQSEGKIESVTLHQNGQDIAGKKVE